MKPINSHIIKFFNTLADETRLKILVSISKGPLTVNEIHKKVNDISLSGVSHQLKIMSDLDIIKLKRDGRKKYVSLSNKYCWCILRDAFTKIKSNHKCEHCANIAEEGGIVI